MPDNESKPRTGAIVVGPDGNLCWRVIAYSHRGQPLPVMGGDEIPPYTELVVLRCVASQAIWIGRAESIYRTKLDRAA